MKFDNHEMRKCPFNTQFVNPFYYHTICFFYGIDYEDLITDGDEIYQQLIAEHKGWA